MALGEERNTHAVNEPGTYQDPESGKELTVTMPAGADALVRLGWVLVKDKKSAKPAGSSAGQEDDSESDKKVYKTVKLSNGNTRYYRNGVPISQAVYEKEAPVA